MGKFLLKAKIYRGVWYLKPSLVESYHLQPTTEANNITYIYNIQTVLRNELLLALVSGIRYMSMKQHSDKKLLKGHYKDSASTLLENLEDMFPCYW